MLGEILKVSHAYRLGNFCIFFNAHIKNMLLFPAGQSFMDIEAEDVDADDDKQEEEELEKELDEEERIVRTKQIGFFSRTGDICPSN
jgi:hypothetical protein